MELRAVFNLHTLVEELIALHARHAGVTRIDLVTHIDARLPALLVGDPTDLSQALSSLLANAIRFTEQGEVRVAVTLAAAPSTRADAPLAVQFEVRDTGIGITPEALARLFDVPAGHAPSLRFGGSGHGLAITRQLIERMGGRLEAASEPGHGSRFHFIVPFTAATGQALAPDALAALAGLRVLLVEDNAVNQEVARAMLAGLGCNVALAGNGREALEAMTRERFSLVMMDCQMPEMDGFEAVRRLRNPACVEYRLQTARDVPVVAITANALAGDGERCLAAGFSGYLSKPFQQRQLAAIVQRWARRSTPS